MSNLQSDLAREKKKLEGMKNHDAVQLKKERQEVEELRQRLSGGGHGARTSLQKREERLDLMEGLSKQVIEETEAKIERLQALLDEQDAGEQKQAREGLKAMKEKALKQWLLQGGTQAGFDQAWPLMEVDLLRQRTLAALESDQSDPRDVVAKAKADLLKARTLAALESDQSDPRDVVAKKRDLIGGL